VVRGWRIAFARKLLRSAWHVECLVYRCVWQKELEREVVLKVVGKASKKWLCTGERAFDCRRVRHLCRAHDIRLGRDWRWARWVEVKWRVRHQANKSFARAV
jgi:hypothetical protein